ncbi:MAG: hypothetical protein IJG60_05550 [Thermoguttaceae bacterium]|nr:hypothetical protein [Thermoguttaceae bacterium]
MARQKKLDIVLISVMALFSLLFALVSSRLFGGNQEVPPLSLSRKFYYAGLIGFAVLAILIKKRRWFKNRFNVHKKISTRQLNIFLITLTLLGPLLFILGLSMLLCAAFDGPVHPFLIFFGLVCAGPLGAISGIAFLMINIKKFKKPAFWFVLTLFSGLVISNLFCFAPLGSIFENRFGVNIYGWIISLLSWLLSWIF